MSCGMALGWCSRAPDRWPEHVIADHHQNVVAATGRIQHSGMDWGLSDVAVFTHAGLDEGIELVFNLGRLLSGVM